MFDLKAEVSSFLDNYSISGKVLCALSGGCDSVVLAYLLHSLNLDVTAIHLNHNWRGEESKRDEEFSKEFSKNLGIDFYSEQLPEDIKKTEACARDARYDFFERCAKKFNTPYVFLAHNKDDNAQTILYRIIKGTGLCGLCGIPSNRGIFYRPLINAARKEIEIFAKENNLKYITDSSNSDIKYKRNFIRKEIIKKLEQVNPDAINALCSMSELSKMQYAIVQNALNQAKKKVYADDKIILDEFLKCDTPVQFEIMNDFLGEDLKYRDFKRIKSYVDFILSCGTKKSLNSELFLVVQDGYIYKSDCAQEKFEDEMIIKSPGVYDFLGKKIEIKQVYDVKNLNPDDGAKYLNIDFNEEICLRTRRDADIFCPFGMKSGKMKLQDYLVNKKVPQKERSRLPLLAKGNEILCILNIQISEKCRADSKKCYEIKVWE